MASRLQIEQREIEHKLDTDGYIILKNQVSEKSLVGLRESLTTLISSASKPGEDIFQTIVRLDRETPEKLYRIYQFASRTLTSMDGIRTDLMPLISSLLPKGTVIDLGSAIIFGIPNDDRLTWQWHQEAPYDPAIKPILSVNMPVFEPATVENGTISLLKGSHKLGSLPYNRVQESPDASTSLIPEGVEKFANDYDEAYFVAEPGDIILFYEDLVHRSNQNQTEHPRITFVGRFASIQGIPEHATVVDGKPY